MKTAIYWYYIIHDLIYDMCPIWLHVLSSMYLALDQMIVAIARVAVFTVVLVIVFFSSFFSLSLFLDEITQSQRVDTWWLVMLSIGNKNYKCSWKMMELNVWGGERGKSQTHKKIMGITANLTDRRKERERETKILDPAKSSYSVSPACTTIRDIIYFEINRMRIILHSSFQLVEGTSRSRSLTLSTATMLIALANYLSAISAYASPHQTENKLRQSST